jgi:putative ABC transport system permease protein
MTEAGDPRRLTAARTIGRFFDVFGVVPAVGRLYRADESSADQSHVAVLSHALWQELGGERAIVGKGIILNCDRYEVIGVAPRGFDYPRATDVYLPMPMTAQYAQNRGQMIWNVVGRMKTGITRAQFDAGIAGEQRRWHMLPGGSYDKLKQFLNIVPLTTMLAGQLRPVLLVLLGAVGFVLLIACANVASLQLVHGTVRARELAVRAALGAERGVILRQLLVENLLLSIGGGVLGLITGQAILIILARFGSAQIPALEHVSLSSLALAFTALATIVSGLVFGLAPAVRGSRVDLNTTLKDATRGGSMSGRKHRLLQSAVVAQVALTVLLLLGSGLLIQSLRHLLAQQPGFSPERLVSVRTTAAGPRYTQPGALTTFYDELLARVRGVPGVNGVGVVGELPFSGMSNSSPFRVIGRDADPNGPETHANIRVVNDAYFATMGIPLLRGRTFDATDITGAPNAAIIDAQLAKLFFPNEDPIGKRINQGPDAVIVGVVGSVAQGELGEPPKATFYYTYRQYNWYPTMFVVVRSNLPAGAVASIVRDAVKQIDPHAPVFDVRTVEERISESLAPRRLAMIVLTSLAAVSLTLAIFGLYGVVSYVVSERTTEFGIRAALGAEPSQVRALVVAQGMRLAIAGVALGVAAAWVASNALAALLFGVSVHDAVTFATTGVLVIIVAAAASWIPARRATAIPLIDALRAG